MARAGGDDKALLPLSPGSAYMGAMRSTILLAALLLATPAFAHHPGSHASRQPDGRVRIDVAVTAGGCTFIDEIATGAPGGLMAPPGTIPVTVKLKTAQGTCAALDIAVLREEAVLSLPQGASHVSLYVLNPAGGIKSTERVPIR